MSCLMLNMHEYFFNSHIHEFHDFDDMQALAQHDILTHIRSSQTYYIQDGKSVTSYVGV